MELCSPPFSGVVHSSPRIFFWFLPIKLIFFCHLYYGIRSATTTFFKSNLGKSEMRKLGDGVIKWHIVTQKCNWVIKISIIRENNHSRVFDGLPTSDLLCHFHGRVVSHGGISAAISDCTELGLMGVIVHENHFIILQTIPERIRKRERVSPIVKHRKIDYAHT